MPTNSDAFDIKPAAFKGTWASPDAFLLWLCQELDLAIAARSGVASEIRYNWDYYEQNRMRGNNAPWPDAADLPSPYAPEYTDAVHARLMQTIFVEPMWTVEGFGPSASRAPFVEEFHQKAQEDERLQTYADEWALRGLIEGVGTLEITEAYEVRREVQRKRVALEVDPATGLPIQTDDGPQLQRDPETQNFVPVEDPNIPSAEVDVDVLEPVRLGPEYDVIPYLDFGVLPAHARNRKQIWGYWKRFYRRVPQLAQCAKDGIYDTEAVDKAGTDNDRGAVADEAPANIAPVSQEGPTAQKELYELQLLADVDGKGERWWRVTIHKERRALLRMKFDDRTTRYIRWMPFPKPGNMDRGYSLIGNKLITVLEEDTARRNMRADLMAKIAGAPIKKLQGALWDEFEQPFGPRAVITVRDMREIEPMQMPDVPQSMNNWAVEVRQSADRLIGQNDVSQGQLSDESKTLGEVQLVAGYAEVRTNLLIKRMQEPLEELGLARHNIWKRTLASNPNLPPQRALVIGREAQGIDQPYVGENGTVTAEMLEGTFWFKPKGSVETADLNRQRQDTNGLLHVLPGVMQMSPAIAAIFQTIPAAKALIEQILRVYRWPDRQSFIGSEANGVFDQMQMQQQMMQDPTMQILMAMGGGGGGAQGALPPGPGGPMAGGAPPPGVM